MAELFLSLTEKADLGDVRNYLDKVRSKQIDIRFVYEDCVLTVSGIVERNGQGYTLSDSRQEEPHTHDIDLDIARFGPWWRVNQRSYVNRAKRVDIFFVDDGEQKEQ